MKQTYAIVNQKGGVGKSTTAHALGAGLAIRGQRVLLIDLDQQANLSYALGVDGAASGSGAVLLGTADTASSIVKAQGMDILPADAHLAGADLTITKTGKEYRLREALAPLLDAYDYIILDTPPAMGILSVNALTAATQVIVPVQADIFSLQGVSQLLDTFAAVRQYTNPGLSVRGLLLTRYSDRAVLSRNVRQMAEEAAKIFDSVVFDTAIREAIAVKEAQISRASLYEWAPKSNVAADYMAFVEEVLS